MHAAPRISSFTVTIIEAPYMKCTDSVDFHIVLRTTMFSSLCFLALVSTLLTVTLTPTGAATLGVAYGRVGDNLPPAREVVALYKSQGIKGMRLYNPNQEVLQALKGSHIQLVLGVANEQLQQLASNTASARRWVQTNVVNYWPNVTIKYIAVGNEVTPVNHNSRYARFVVPAMRNIFNAIRDAGLFQKVIVTTALDTTVIGTSYPPSAGKFRRDVMWFMNPLIAFLINTRATYMTSVYPFFAYTNDPNVKLSYALFTNKRPEFIDHNLKYYNLFDAILDGVHSALGRVVASRLVGVHSILEKAPHWNMPVAASESGWSHGGRPAAGRRNLLYSDHGPSISHACTYNQNLIRHVTSGNGTPKRPGVSIETYIFAMFDENLKPGPATEKYFGLFYPNKKPVCRFNFTST